MMILLFVFGAAKVIKLLLYTNFNSTLCPPIYIFLSIAWLLTLALLTFFYLIVAYFDLLGAYYGFAQQASPVFNPPTVSSISFLLTSTPLSKQLSSSVFRLFSSIW
jgi:hypothetical protein